MTLVKLKEMLTNKLVPTDFMIFIKKDNNFLAEQYLKEIITISSDKAINYVTSIYEPQQSAFFLLTQPEDSINICRVENFEERAEDYDQFESTIVICDSVDKSILKLVEDYIIKFPKFFEWHIFDYVKSVCPELDDEDINWLIQICNKDEPKPKKKNEPSTPNTFSGGFERLLNEVDKLLLFAPEERKNIFNQLRFDPQTDLYKFTFFGLADAIVYGDLNLLREFLKRRDADSFEPVGLVNQATVVLKNIILLTQNPYLTAEQLDINRGTGWYIRDRFKQRPLNLEAAKRKFNFLLEFDYKLKTSQLEMSKQDLLNYIIVNTAYSLV